MQFRYPPLVRELVVETLDFEIRYELDASNQSPGRLTGTLLTYEDRADDRPEIFTTGSLHWPDGGIIINQQHDRARPIVRAVPFMDGNAVKIDAPLPNTTAGRDAAENVRAGVLTGLSVEFFAEKVGRRGNMREIRQALLGAAGLVDTSSYKKSTVEIREGITTRPWQVFQWL